MTDAAFDTPEALLDAAGVSSLDYRPKTQEVHKVLAAVSEALNGADPLFRQSVRNGLWQQLRSKDVPGAQDLATATIRSSVKKEDETQGEELTFDDPAPWPDEVNGAELLDELEAYFSRYLILPDGATAALALWTAATWFVEHFHIAPILSLLSPMPQCGKSLTIDLISFVGRRPLSTVGVTTAALFRTNNEFRPTFLIDEAEVLGDKRSSRAQELTAILNAGHRKGQKVLRCEGDNNKVKAFDPFGFKVLAAIGGLKDTLEDRSIIVPMERAPKGAIGQQFVYEVVEEEAAPLASQLARWSEDAHMLLITALRAIHPPDWLGHRVADNWRALFAVAEVAGGRWPSAATEASRKLTEAVAGENVSEITLLLSDIRDLFSEMGADRLPSSEICHQLGTMEERPWPEHSRGERITATQLAALLKPFKVKPKLIRFGAGNDVARGYYWSDLNPIFERYLPPQEEPKRDDEDGCNGLGEGCNTPCNTLCNTHESGESRCGTTIVTPVTVQEQKRTPLSGSIPSKPSRILIPKERVMQGWPSNSTVTEEAA